MENEHYLHPRGHEGHRHRHRLLAESTWPTSPCRRGRACLTRPTVSSKPRGAWSLTRALPPVSQACIGLRSRPLLAVELLSRMPAMSPLPSPFMHSVTICQGHGFLLDQDPTSHHLADRDVVLDPLSIWASCRVSTTNITARPCVLSGLANRLAALSPRLATMP
ncbi:hypothetical protein Micbo1qcDRAFT_162748, partial [Microdochium bolleyi]